MDEATIAKFIADGMRGLTLEDRVAFMHELTEYYCPHCGREQPDRGCQCNNDE